MCIAPAKRGTPWAIGSPRLGKAGPATPRSPPAYAGPLGKPARVPAAAHRGLPNPAGG
ncbi:hypothetical protein Xcc1_02700 [Xanthomonas campestris pv. campestris]|nr:hypothetical protein Xcc1_02700 [Xanthomonas campestris pv. campestris]